MNITRLLATTALGILCIGSVQAGPVVDDSDMGLSKTSVFATPTPSAFQWNEVDTDDAKSLPRAYEGAPPQIPHEVTIFLPLTAEDNECLECHDKPKYLDNPKEGESPMPRSHYTGRWINAGEVRTKAGGRLQVNGAQYLCTQCHVPQAEVKTLVGNTFSK